MHRPFVGHCDRRDQLTKRMITRGGRSGREGVSGAFEHAVVWPIRGGHADAADEQHFGPLAITGAAGGDVAQLAVSGLGKSMGCPSTGLKLSACGRAAELMFDGRSNPRHGLSDQRFGKQVLPALPRSAHGPMLSPFGSPTCSKSHQTAARF